ncbi:hypothetical protein B0H10DRAFT_1958595 [Mycena sp. CBHHK59/15]|nr:hypothetical protein B0H10DRAFT_1958595 [Mycena sp. CBHHK59/15]
MQHTSEVLGPTGLNEATTCNFVHFAPLPPCKAPLGHILVLLRPIDAVLTRPHRLVKHEGHGFGPGSAGHVVALQRWVNSVISCDPHPSMPPTSPGTSRTLAARTPHTAQVAAHAVAHASRITLVAAHAKPRQTPYLRCCSAISPPSLPLRTSCISSQRTVPSPTTNLRPRATFALSIRGAANPSLQLPHGRRAVHIPALVVRSLLRTSYLCDIAACPIPRSVRVLALDCSTVLPLYRARHRPARFFNVAPAGMARTQHATDLTYFP